jgi:hypothetical protein
LLSKLDGEVGWLAQGATGQLWEYGIHELGFTVGSGKMIEGTIAAGFTISHRGAGDVFKGRRLLIG